MSETQGRIDLKLILTCPYCGAAYEGVVEADGVVHSEDPDAPNLGMCPACACWHVIEDVDTDRPRARRLTRRLWDSLPDFYRRTLTNMSLRLLRDAGVMGNVAAPKAGRRYE